MLVTPNVLHAWRDECDPQSCDSLPADASVLQLFSSNDYMGMSCHPAVCKAAADAVLRHGMGTTFAASLRSNWHPLRLNDSLSIHRTRMPWTLSKNINPTSEMSFALPRGGNKGSSDAICLTLTVTAAISCNVPVQSHVVSSDISALVRLLEVVLLCAGPRSSAVVGGYTFLHEELEVALADLKETEECLLFPTGFAANVAVVSALCSTADVTIFSDELNHASIIDGARLASRNQVLPPSQMPSVANPCLGCCNSMYTSFWPITAVSEEF